MMLHVLLTTLLRLFFDMLVLAPKISQIGGGVPEEGGEGELEEAFLDLFLLGPGPSALGSFANAILATLLDWAGTFTFGYLRFALLPVGCFPFPCPTLGK